MNTAEQDNFTAMLEEIAPFLKWLHIHNVVQFSAPGFSRTPIDNELVIYVKHKIPDAELKDDWNVLWQIYNGPNRNEFLNVDKQSCKIPDTIQGWPTKIVERKLLGSE